MIKIWNIYLLNLNVKKGTADTGGGWDTGSLY